MVVSYITVIKNVIHWCRCN